MRLLKKLFGQEAWKAVESVSEVMVSPGISEEHRTVLDLFREDLGSIRLDTFTEGKAEVQADGDIIRNYYKCLENKEYGIFDMMYARLIGHSINIVFKSSRPSEMGMAKMQKLIDDLYSIYGKDNAGKGCYDHDDATEYADEHFCVLFGRDWMDYPRYTYPVTIRRYPDEVFISIWGLNQNNIIA